MKSKEEYLEDSGFLFEHFKLDNPYSANNILIAMQKYAIDYHESEVKKLGLFGVSGSCSCGVKYVETKKSDIPYDTDDNVYYTDIMIYHCPKCGNIDRIEEY